jgi:hypothetical protein
VENMTNTPRRVGPLASLAVVVAVLVTGVALAAGTAAARTSQASAYRLTAILAPGQVVPAVQAPPSAVGHFRGFLVQGGVGAVSAALRAGCSVAQGSAPPSKSLRPNRPNVARCIGAAGALPATSAQWRFFWRLTVSGLSGPATSSAVHIAPVGHAAAPLMALCAPCHAVSHSSTLLTDAQANALIDDTAYVDVATAAHPAGEIRGQIAKTTLITIQK